MTQKEIKLLLERLEDENRNYRFSSSMCEYFNDRYIYEQKIFFNNGQIHILRKLIND